MNVRAAAALRRAGRKAQALRYQGETLNFESPGALFGRLSERRWALVTAFLGQGSRDRVMRPGSGARTRWATALAPHRAPQGCHGHPAGAAGVPYAGPRRVSPALAPRLPCRW
jgi:hypothetical protein